MFNFLFTINILGARLEFGMLRFLKTLYNILQLFAVSIVRARVALTKYIVRHLERYE